jgi:hypothetical protein
MIVKEMHDQLILGHPEIARTLALFKQDYY